jgi:hypothetical protein
MSAALVADRQIVATPDLGLTDGDVAARPFTSHIFVVGVSRSGTSLMRRILNTSPDVALCRENHYLGHLLPGEGVRQQLRRLGDLHDDAAIERAARFIYEGGLARGSRLREPSSQWAWLTAHVSQEEFADRLRNSDRSERAVFDVMLDSYAEYRAKRVRGEKTPAHVRYIDELLEWYPDARVVHMLRDPRGVYVSELRRRREVHSAHPYRELARIGDRALAAFVLAETIVAWADGARRAQAAARRYGSRYIVVRFEDLVRDPEHVIRRLCESLGIEFVPAMLDQRVVSRGHGAGTSGFDPRAADRWQGAIGSRARRVIDTALLRTPRMGYQA